MGDLNTKYLGITAGVALLVVLGYHYVIKDYLPGSEA